MPKKTTTVATVGYEGTTMPAFLRALREGGVQLLVDVRAVASSRRPGFSTPRLAAHLSEAGIDYLPLRSLGPPADGRAAARSGRHEEMHRIFQAHLRTDEARDGMETLVELAQGERRVCLLCFEADPAHCHRTLVAEALGARVPIRVEHLRPQFDAEDEARD